MIKTEAQKPNTAKPRLRFDQVAMRLIKTLQTNLAESVPLGTTVLVTVTAPIRLPSKTTAALEVKIQRLLGRAQDIRRDAKNTIHGNEVRIRLWRHEFSQRPRVMVFVHNPESDPLLILKMNSTDANRVSDRN